MRTHVIKAALVCAIVATLVSPACAALDADWAISTRATVVATGQASQVATLGTYVGASDAFIMGEDISVYPPARYVDTYLTGSVGDPGYVIQDFRSPCVMPGPGDPPIGTKWDHHTIIPDPGTPQPCELSFWVDAQAMIDQASGGGMELYVDLMDSTMSNTLFTFTSGMSGSVSSPNFQMTLNNVDSNFQNPDTTFWLVVGVVPEPGTFAALLAGIAGLGVTALRRRR